MKQAAVNVAGGSGRGAYTITLFHFNDSAFKHELYIRRIQDRQGPKWHLPHNIGADFIQQVTAEKLVERKNARGVPEAVWHRIRRDNHFGDCEKMQLVQGHLLAPQLKTKLDPAASGPQARPARERVRIRVGSWSGQWGGWKG